MTSLLELLRAGASDERVLAWEADAAAAVRASEVDVLKDSRVHFNQRTDPAVALAGLTAGRTETEVLEIVRWCSDPGRRDLVDAIVARRTQQWRERLFKAATTDRFGSGWWLIRALMRVGVKNKPGDLYLFKLMAGPPQEHGAEAGRRIVEFLLNDPGLLDDEIFQLMSTEGVTRNLSGWQGRTPWLDAIEQLAGGDLRDRILDTVWSGLVSDWQPVDQRPLLQLVKRLTPSEDERFARLSGLLRMTSSDNAPIVVWALKQLTDLLGANRLDADALLAIRAPLTMRDKGTATAHLALLEKALRTQVGDPSAIAQTAALALDHPHEVIRTRAAKLVAKHAPDRVVIETPVAPMVGKPLLRPQVPAFSPIIVAADFVDLLIASLAQDLSGIEVEQLLEATPRFAFHLDAKARRSIAQARARHARGARYSSSETWHLADAIAAVDAARPTVGAGVFSADFKSFDVMNYAQMLEQRFIHLAWAMTRANVYTGLATPSRTDGTIALTDLQARFAAATGLGTLRVEIATAAMRLDPGDYDAAEAPGALSESEASRAFVRDVRRIREHQPDWTLNRFLGVQERILSELDPAAPAGRRTRAVIEDTSDRPTSEPDVLAALLDRRELAGTRRSAIESRVVWRKPMRAQTELLSLTLPHHREHYASHVLGVIRAGLVNDDCDPVAPLILGLGTGHGRTGLASTFALASATALRHAEDRAAVVDALVERATYGELDGPALGRALRELIENDGAIARRVAAAIAEAGNALGPLSGPVVDALIELLPLLRPLRDGHAFVAILADLSRGLGRTIDLPEDLAELNGKRASTALARAVHRVPVR